MPVGGAVTLKVYDILWREVRTLVEERERTGSHFTSFDANGLPSGVYFYRLQLGNYEATRKPVLIK
jgi:hypothetical protein